ncbi:damage-inducible protein [Solimonas sp. K1W22B-7]|uniref:CinA family protein n=1 Tax=Solimonas sp. K1W22B-7 TaxID=2303331 RepID=UPI000E334FB5|nr:CinA family protein [Solimonas sp. K1W22B-7]AXQ30564.1 damage-inducible protein [Solimonas sp. K1W22B-7]
MRDILVLGQKAGLLLKERGDKIAVAETSAGGLIAASLLAQAGASAYFAGGAITYSARAIRGLVGISTDEMRERGIRSSSEPYAQWLAEAVKAKHGRIAWGEPGLSWSALNGTPRRRTPGHGWPGRGQMGELKPRHGWHPRVEPLTL